MWFGGKTQKAHFRTKVGLVVRSGRLIRASEFCDKIVTNSKAGISPTGREERILRSPASDDLLAGRMNITASPQAETAFAGLALSRPACLSGLLLYKRFLAQAEIVVGPLPAGHSPRFLCPKAGSGR